MPGLWPSLDPEELLDRQVSWVKNLDDGETLVNSTFTVADGDVEISTQSFSDTIATVWLTGGTLDTTCEVLNHIVTSAGREREQTMKIKIKAK